MSASDRASRLIYSGVWAALASLFRVPREPPDLPVAPGESVEKLRPAPGYLAYQKFWFWLLLIPLDLLILIGWAIITWWKPWLGAVLAIPAFLIAVLPDILAYILIHLRYDTTWYVISPRTIRIRRGVMSVVEMTITFENVQNVKTRQGPVQRRFGIGQVLIETAGVAHRGPHGQTGANQGVLDGIADLEAMRAHILAHVRSSRSAGLGDDHLPSRPSTHWSPDHLLALREIRDELRALPA